MSPENENKIIGITISIVFENSSMNRDQSVGNIMTLKKLTIGNTDHIMLSRQWMTNKIINTLVSRFPDDWKPAPLTVAKKVIQYELLKPGEKIKVVGDIINYAELDAFGYMSTAEKKKRKKEQEEEDSDKESNKKNGIQVTLTRKAPVSATKAISLYPWKGDMGFYANHAMVSRYNETSPEEPATPDPYSKEECYSLFKFSVTIDLKMLGEDTWFLPDNVINKLDIPKIEDKYGTVELNKEKKSLKFKLNPETKTKRVLQILDVLKDGLIAHGSGENYGIIPLFIVAAPVKIPIPLFHSIIQVNHETGKIVVEDMLNIIKDNGYIVREGDKPIVYIQSFRKDILDEKDTKALSDYCGYNGFKDYIKDYIENHKK